MSTKPNSLVHFIAQLSGHQKLILSAFIFLKIALILMLPLTGDEAYFITWGQHLALGYYDHPPAVGWVLYLLGLVSDDLNWYRFFAFVSAMVIAYLLYKLISLNSEVSQNTAFWLALAFFVSPISLMFVVTANDTVLALFAMLGLYFFAKALQGQKWLDVLLAGLLLGMAFLSKYFAGFMLFGLLAYALWHWKHINVKQLVVMVSIVLLAVAENLYFNVTHCWNNILFNFFSRTEASQFAIENVISYLLMIAVLLSPLGLWYLFKNRANVTPEPDAWFNPSQFVLFASIPLLMVLLLVSFGNQVGLHWPLIAVIALYVVYQSLSPKQLQKLFVFNGYFSLVAAIILLVALSMVEQLISPSQKHHVAVYTQPEQVCKALPQNQTFFTLDYSSQSALSYHCGNDDIHVFASKSKYGREDDKLTDFKSLNGQNLLVFVTQEKDIEKVEPYFEKVKVKPIIVDKEIAYYLLTGKNFDYEFYREQIILPVNEKFYSAPEWFPKWGNGCAFKQKYDLD